MGVKIKIDRAGIQEMLKSDAVAVVISDLADEIAAIAETDPAVTRHGMPVQTSEYVTDRFAVAVDIAHPGGLGVEAKYGVLTRAAAEVGLDVREVAV